MGKLDAVAKKYLGKQEAFADVFNYLIFDGKQVIKPGELKELDSNQVAVLFKDKDIKDIEKQRDLFRLWTAMSNDDAVFVLFGAEIQGSVHYAMPIKTGLYDFITYDGQLSNIAADNWQKHKAKEIELHGGEYLYGFRKEDKVKLVITATIYVGKKPWDGPMMLSDIVSDGAKKLMTPYDDYRLRLISAMDMDDAEFGKFATELGDVMKFVKHQGIDTDKLIEQTNHKIYSLEAAAFVKVAANMDLDFEVKNGGVDMCEALERRYKKERNVGEQDATKVINYLWKNGRGEEAERAEREPDFLDKLLKEIMPVLTPAK